MTTLHDKLDGELLRLAEKLTEIEPVNNAYNTVCENMATLVFLKNKLSELAEAADSRCSSLRSGDGDAEAAETEAPKQMETEVAEQPKTEAAEPIKPAMTYEQLRGPMADARARGFDVLALIRSRGFKKLSDVPPELYGVIYEELQGLINGT